MNVAASVVLKSSARLAKTNHLSHMSAQESPKIQVRLPIGGKNYIAMPLNEDANLYQICWKLSLLYKNMLRSSLMRDEFMSLKLYNLTQLILPFISVSNIHLRQWHLALLRHWHCVATI